MGRIKRFGSVINDKDKRRRTGHNDHMEISRMDRCGMSKIKKAYSCSLILTNDLIGGKWKLRILWHIMHGDNRFSLLSRAIPDITQKVLVSQLKELEYSGIIKRKVVHDKPPKTILYSIAEDQSELIPIIDRICNYTKQYAKEKSIYVADADLREN